MNNHLDLVTRKMASDTGRGIFRVWTRAEFKNDVSVNRKRRVRKLFFQTSFSVTREFRSPPPYIEMFPGQILNLKHNWNPALGFQNNAKVVVVGVHVPNSHPQFKPITLLQEAIEIAVSPHGLHHVEILVRHLSGSFTGPSALPDYPGIFTVPVTPIKYVRYGGVQFSVRYHHVHPANAISCHQSQGSTLPRSVACLDANTERYYGMANVVTSRTPSPDNFALTTMVTGPRLMLKPLISKLVESEYARLQSLLDRTRQVLTTRVPHKSTNTIICLVQYAHISYRAEFHVHTCYGLLSPVIPNSVLYGELNFCSNSPRTPR